MIIFYKKKTGKIVGAIEGRIHGEEHLNLWVGERYEIGRIIFNWKKNEFGEYEPDVKDKNQKEIIKDIDKQPTTVYDFIINIATKKLVRKAKKGDKGTK